MSDLINRQELLDRVNYLINQVKYCKVGTLTFKDGLMDGYCEIRSIVKEFPSAQPEPPWIPCSERMPECEQEVLISQKRKGKGRGDENDDTGNDRLYQQP